jgi:hypothetical protein
MVRRGSALSKRSWQRRAALARYSSVLEFSRNRQTRGFFMSLAPTLRERFVDGDAVVTIPLDDALQSVAAPQ